MRRTAKRAIFHRQKQGRPIHTRDAYCIMFCNKTKRDSLTSRLTTRVTNFDCTDRIVLAQLSGAIRRTLQFIEKI